MSWFGNAIPLIAMGKKTVKQPVYVSEVERMLPTLFCIVPCVCLSRQITWKPVSFRSGGGCGESYHQRYQRPGCQRKDVRIGWVGVSIWWKRITVAAVFVRRYVRDQCLSLWVMLLYLWNIRRNFCVPVFPPSSPNRYLLHDLVEYIYAVAHRSFVAYPLPRPLYR